MDTDQPPELGGEGAAPAPFDFFLASLATCAGIYPTTKLPTRVELVVGFPAGFPEKYKPAALRAAESCKVKEVLASPPDFVVRAGETPREGLSAASL